MNPKTGRRRQDKGRDGHNLLTVNGWVRIQRKHYYHRQDGSSAPIDALLDATEATVSAGVREMCSRVGVEARSFARAAATLERTAQLRINRETLRRIVEDDGKAALRLSESGELAPDWKAQDCMRPDGKSLIYLSSDGFMVPLVTQSEKQKRRQQVLERRKRCGKKRRALGRVKRGVDQRYKEFKAVAFYDHEMAHRLVLVTRGDCRQAGRLMRRGALQIGFGSADDRVGNIDGGPWIINQIKRRRLPMTATGLDFYHLGENVHKARRALFGEDSSAGQEQAGALLHTAKHEGYGPLWERLLELRKNARGPTRRKAADGLLNYVCDRREMIRYPEFLAHGWQIGSGPMESQCRVVPDRVKGPGKRWDADNAEAIMALEALHQSRLWPNFWRALRN